MTDLPHIALLVTAGDGPAECNQAVGHVLTRMQAEADALDITLSITRTETPSGPKSAVLVAHGMQARAFAKAWLGTILWQAKSARRPNHKRSNWFVGVFELGEKQTAQPVPLRKSDVVFSTLRAGGPGGQHQNTTDSAVRAVHQPTGLTVVVREARSQHRNKALALERLQSLADAQSVADAAQSRTNRHQRHQQLERGNPVRRFVGAAFSER